MKKNLLIIGALAVAITANAAAPAMSVFQFQLSSASSSVDKLLMVESASYSDAYDYGVDNEKNLSVTNPSVNTAIYAMTSIYTSGRADKLGTNDLNGKYIGVMTNTTDATYTFTFLAATYLAGRADLYLLDKVTKSMTKITKDASYSFTLNKAPSTNTYINDRFMIYQPATPDPGDLQVCHVGNELQVKNNPYATNIVVKNEAGETVIDQVPFATPQTISLSALPKGRYTVEFNDGKEVFVISVKPDVTPAN